MSHEELVLLQRLIAPRSRSPAEMKNSSSGCPGKDKKRNRNLGIGNQFTECFCRDSIFIDNLINGFRYAFEDVMVKSAETT